jgi:hypothetical protein
MQKERTNMEQDQTESVTTFYRNTIGYNEGKDKVFVYTESKEDWKTFSKELSSLVLYQAMKAFMIGILIGLFTGFFTARADEATVRRVILKEAQNLEQASALLAIAQIESSFRPNVKGKALEYGLFQFHPKYFKLKDKSIRGQIRFAITHYNELLTNGCKDEILGTCWNTGIGGSRKLKNPKKFAYNVKFIRLKAKYEKEIVENQRTYASNFCQNTNVKNIIKTVREGQIKSAPWPMARRREYDISSI